MTKSARPKIAVLIDWYIPGTKAGGPVRSIYSLCESLKTEFDFCIFTLNHDLGSKTAYSGIKANEIFEKDGVQYIYFSEDKADNDNVLQKINDFSPSLIYINSFWSYPFSISIVRAKKQGKLNAPLILAPRGMLGSGALGLKSFKKQLFLVYARLSGVYKQITFHASNEIEKKAIQNQFPKACIFTVPNINSGSAIDAFRKKETGELNLFYLSRIARVKNLHFALHTLNQLPSELKINYDIYGNLEDTDYWNECLNIIAQLPPNIKVQYKKELDFTEVQQVISHYHALYLPTLNENYGHSIVESLLSGCSVICSDQTPWNDMETYHAGYAIALKNEKKFKEVIDQLAREDQDQFNRRSKAAINYISSKLNLSQNTELYKKMFNGATEN